MSIRGYLTKTIILSSLMYFSQICYGNTEHSEEDIYYLSEAIYFESGIEPTIGQIFVGRVILNRVKSKYWPNTIKGVVHQVHGKVGQFSYYSDGKPENIPEGILEKIKPVAVHLLETKDGLDIADGANHYYNPELANPSWANKMDYIIRIGDHVFLRDNR